MGLSESILSGWPRCLGVFVVRNAVSLSATNRDLSKT
jgi:hypothetical protein